MIQRNCQLQFSDGSDPMLGQLIGAPLVSSGELVFSTGMVGYSESISDPSYYGQILVFTYPLIGNYGIPKSPSFGEVPSHVDDIPFGFESSKAQTAGVVINVASVNAFHWSSLGTLDEWLKSQKVPGVVGIDTRELVCRIRENGTLLARIVPDQDEGVIPQTEDIFDHRADFFNPSNLNVLPRIATSTAYTVGKGSKRIGLVDCGVKWNIVRQLVEHDMEVRVLPPDANLMEEDVSGFVLSNGPGDPRKAESTILSVRSVLEEGKRPVLGICLGHQILAQAAGAEIKRMKFGHRSHNQPVYEVGKRKGYITSQNHGYVVDETTLPKDWDVWFRNCNDESCEGIRHTSGLWKSVQFHPEASGGPRDTAWILEMFAGEKR